MAILPAYVIAHADVSAARHRLLTKPYVVLASEARICLAVTGAYDRFER